MPDLKLIALDADDLAVLSAHLQDAVLRVGDMAYLPREKRFAMLANRFDWVEAAGGRTKSFQRRRAGVRVERVLDAQLTKIELGAKETCLELLAIAFEPAEPPEGFILLHFAGGAGVRLRVECIEAGLEDQGAAWATRVKPDHPADREPGAA